MCCSAADMTIDACRSKRRMSFTALPRVQPGCGSAGRRCAPLGAARPPESSLDSAWALANDSLTSWLVALGMDQERGLLLAACLAVVLGAALGTAVTGRPG